MSAIWEDDFFYTSDLGTPDNPDDDIVFRGGYEERVGALNMFNNNGHIDLNLSQHGDIEFLNETLAMVDFDYEMTLVQRESGEPSYPSGRMIFIWSFEKMNGVFLNGTTRQHHIERKNR